MAIRKRASGAGLPTIREDQMLRIALRAGLAATERDIKEAEEFGDNADQLLRIYERKAYLDGLLQHEGHLALVRK